MKTILRTAAIAALVIAASCGKDSADDTAQQQEQQAEQLENTPLEANTVSDNVLIAGATKEEGMPPTPNEAITLDVSGTSKMALLGEGFNVSLNSDANIVGAYIQFKSNDGTAADSYYDINIDSNSADNKSNKSSKFRGKESSLGAKEEVTTKLDVDFSTAIEPGTFCYDICVYDAEGSISAPQEICVTVESWGGFAAAVGNWKMTKEEETEEDGSIVTYLLGEQTCDTVEEVVCDQGGTLEASLNCTTILEENLVINADGTYRYEYDEDYKYLMFTETKENCEAVYENDDYVLNSVGKWAYIAEDESLVFIEFSYETLSDDGSGQLETETHEVGNGESLFDGETEFIGNNFTASQGEYKIYFEK